MTAKQSKTPTTPEPAREDVVLIHGRTEDGKGLQVLRKQGPELSLGEVRPLEEGKPVSGEVVKLRPREKAPFLCDVDVIHRPEAKHDGPAQVATPAYREGWDAIWGTKKTKRETLLN